MKTSEVARSLAPTNDDEVGNHCVRVGFQDHDDMQPLRLAISCPASGPTLVPAAETRQPARHQRRRKARAKRRSPRQVAGSGGPAERT
jgi:hypothetical protein